MAVSEELHSTIIRADLAPAVLSIRNNVVGNSGCLKKKKKNITLDENLLGTYEKWIEKNPYDEGQGWGKVPWSQKEMELTDEIVESAKGADAAIVVVGRTAGEDQDNKNEAGSYLLTDTEKEMVEKVSKAFARTIVVLNVGNIIDMKWVKECNPAAVLYVWQGGQEGGNGVADVLMGRVNPCGKLTDTIAENTTVSARFLHGFKTCKGCKSLQNRTKGAEITG